MGPTHGLPLCSTWRAVPSGAVHVWSTCGVIATVLVPPATATLMYHSLVSTYPMSAPGGRGRAGCRPAIRPRRSSSARAGGSCVARTGAATPVSV
jgi:hypothetical protein